MRVITKTKIRGLDSNSMIRYNQKSERLFYLTPMGVQWTKLTYSSSVISRLIGADVAAVNAEYVFEETRFWKKPGFLLFHC